MKHYISLNPSAKYGYSYVAVDDNGHRQFFDLNQKTTDNYLRLPKNETNRKYVSLKSLEAHDWDNIPHFELTFKEEAGYGKTNSVSEIRKYLSGDDLTTFDSLVKKGIDLMNKPMSDEEKLMAEIKKLEAKLAAMRK